MAKSDSFSLNLGTSTDPVSAKPQKSTPFRVAIFGDLSGRSNRAIVEPATISSRRPLVVDRDNFDQVLARHKIELRMAGPEAKPIDIGFGSLDDFHPDEIFEKLDIFQSLRQLRQRLKNPATFAAAAAEVRSWAESRGAKEIDREPDSPPPAAAAPPPSPGELPDLFDQVLDRSKTQSGDNRSSGRMDWNAYIRSVVEPYSIPGTDPQQPELIGCVDNVASYLMRSLVHHSDFQAIEAVWRAIYFMVRRIETDAKLSLSLIDISKQEMAQDLAQVKDPRSTALYKLIVEQSVGTPGAHPWSVLVGNYMFDHTVEDAQLLDRVGVIAQLAGAPFLAAGHARLLGCESLDQTPDPDDWQRAMEKEAAGVWAALRNAPQSSFLGLALPRFLLRLPYGKGTNPTERLEFDEMGPEPRHGDYLWANPAFAVACLLAQTFSEQGWDMQPGSAMDIDGLPAHVFTQDGEKEVKPCAEVVLTERAIERISSGGLMPLVSFRGRDQVRLAGFWSLRGPTTRLAGRWTGAETE